MFLVDVGAVELCSPIKVVQKSNSTQDIPKAVKEVTVATGKAEDIHVSAIAVNTPQATSVSVQLYITIYNFVVRKYRLAYQMVVLFTMRGTYASQRPH